MIINDKILTYGPNNDVLIHQIGPFIHIYFRQTILSRPKPIKSRGDILFEIFFSLVFQARNLVVFLEWAVKNRITQLWCTTTSNEFLKIFTSQSPTVAEIGGEYFKILTY